MSTFAWVIEYKINFALKKKNVRIEILFKYSKLFAPQYDCDKTLSDQYYSAVGSGI